MHGLPLPVECLAGMLSLKWPIGGKIVSEMTYDVLIRTFNQTVTNKLI